QMTNRIGDDCFLLKWTPQCRRHSPDGDVIFIDGTVTRKFEENGKKYVEVEQKATTHRGELSAFGTAVAELPSKA
ncbi:MAG TPA: acyl dehydratase, partial [Novosphingobium sp.]|nr:acyl dehydratase [Novosphingobium sp.]